LAGAFGGFLGYVGYWRYLQVAILIGEVGEKQQHGLLLED
jgi:hypothetical protein